MDEVEDFLIPKETHLSTLISMFDQVDHLVKGFKCPVTTAASSAN